MYSRKINLMWLYCVVIVMLFVGQVVADNVTTGTACNVGWIPKFETYTSITNSIMYESGGNIGIGTTTPGYILDIVGDTIRLGDRGNGYSGIVFQPDPNVCFHLYSHSSDAMWLYNAMEDEYIWAIQGNGSMGIGTRWPSEKLEVVGGMKIASDSAYKIGSYNGISYASSTIKLANDKVAVDVSTGKVGIGTLSPSEMLTVKGNILVQDSSGNPVLELGTGLDYAEGFHLTEQKEAAPGTVLVIDEENPGKLTVSNTAYDTKVAGVVAGAKGLESGVKLGVDGYDCHVALAGRVYCNVDATDGDIKPGDLLTTSPMAGYAMKAKDVIRSQGTVLGKAMQSLKKGEKGQILVLVNLQ